MMQGENLFFAQKSGFRHPVARGGAGEVGVDEAVEVAVHHRIDVRHLVARARILGERVGHKDIVADLAAPFDLELRALDVGDLVEMLALFDFNELGAEKAFPFPGFFAAIWDILKTIYWIICPLLSELVEWHISCHIIISAV